MKICIVGGIFGKSAEYRNKHKFTPETILSEALRDRGYDVFTVSHAAFRPDHAFDFDVIHIHHLGKAALRMIFAPTSSAFIFTSHNGPILCGYEKSFYRRWIFRLVVNSADHLIGLSEIECLYLRKLAPGVPVSRIPNGIPTNVYHLPSQKRPLTLPLRVLYVGQLIPSKGVDILLKAMALLSEKWDWELVLCYQNSKMEKDYKTMAQNLGIASRVRFAGLLAAEELANLYRISDVTVLPSFAESLPSVITESLLCGTPVVASAVGGIPEQINMFGKTVPPGDPQALAVAIRQVFDELGWYRGLTQQMHEYAANCYGVEQMADKHVYVYKSTVEQKCKHRTRNLILYRFIRSLVGGGDV